VLEIIVNVGIVNERIEMQDLKRGKSWTF